MEQKSVAIIVARCTHSRSHFGIRIELKTRRKWVADWAFALKESSAQKEGYALNRIEGSFCEDDAYPGCPFCSARSLIKCEKCGHLSCFSGKATTVRCPWCGTQGEVGGQVRNLDAGRDR